MKHTYTFRRKQHASRERRLIWDGETPKSEPDQQPKLEEQATESIAKIILDVANAPKATADRVSKINDKKASVETETNQDGKTDTPAKNPESKGNQPAEDAVEQVEEQGLLSEEAKESIREIAELIAEVMQIINGAKAPETAEGDDDKESADKDTPETEDKTSSEDSEKSDGSPETEGKAPETAEALDAKSVQNPREELDSTNEEVTSLKNKEKGLESDLQEAAKTLDGDTTAADREVIQKISEQLTEVEEDIAAKEKQAEALEGELDRRDTLVEKQWNDAVGKSEVPADSRFVQNVDFNEADGDSITFTLKVSPKQTDNQTVQKLSENSYLQGNKYVMENVPAKWFTDAEAFQSFYDKVATIDTRNKEEGAEEGESIDESAEADEKPGNEVENETRTRKVLERNRQRMQKEYDSKKEAGTDTKQDVQNVLDALDAEIAYLESKGINPTRKIDGKDVSLVDRLKKKRADFDTALGRYESEAEANPDEIPESDESYTRKTLESYRQEKERGYEQDPSRKNAQLVINAIDAELQYLRETDQNPQRAGGDGTRTLQDRLVEKREQYGAKLEAPAEDSTEATTEDKAETTETTEQKTESLTPERLRTMRRDMATALARRVGIDENSDAMTTFRNAISITTTEDGKYRVEMIKDLLNQSNLADDSKKLDQVVEGLSTTGGSNLWASEAMDSDQLLSYYSGFITRINRLS